MFQGSIVALVTPMDESGNLDLDSVPRLLDYLLSGGSSGLVVAGTTGESACLDSDEYRQVIAAVVKYVDGEVPVLAGTGSASTAVSIEQTLLAENSGADGALIVTPYYNRPTQAGLQEHYQLIAQSTQLPVILYNVPSRTGVDLQPETVELLSRIGNIVGIKEALVQPGRIAQLRALCGDEFVILSGDDESCAQAILDGANGVISVAANVAPALMAELCRLSLAHDRYAVEQLQGALKPLFAQLAVETNPIPVKWAAYELGLIGSGIRLPLLPLQECFRADLKASLATLGQEPELK